MKVVFLAMSQIILNKLLTLLEKSL